MLCLAAGLVAGCASLLGIEDLPELGDAGSGPGTADASPDSDQVDAAPCAGDLQMVLRVNGEEVPDPTSGAYRLNVLVGDLITLSAAGSCSSSGELAYEWVLAPDPGTAAGGFAADAIDFYPDQVGDYTATLRIQGDSGAPVEGGIQIRAHGWQPVEALAGGGEVTDIRELDVSEGDLWVAANGGAYQLPLTGAQDTFIDLASEATGDIIVGNLSTAYYDQASGNVWFGRNGFTGVVWRLEPDRRPQPVSTAISISDALGENATVHDIGPGAIGVAVATDRGLTETADGETFNGDQEPNNDGNVRSVVSGGGQHWAGGRALYDLNSGRSILPFGGTDGDDNRIVTLVVDEANDDLWVGSADRGIARLSNVNGMPQGIYDDGSSGLATNTIRHLRVETGRYAGDVWAATDQGVARYIRARDTWITMGDAHGLNGNLDVKAIAIDEADGRRAIYAGTINGVVHLRVP